MATIPHVCSENITVKEIFSNYNTKFCIHTKEYKIEFLTKPPSKCINCRIKCVLSRVLSKAIESTNFQTDDRILMSIKHSTFYTTSYMQKDIMDVINNLAESLLEEKEANFKYVNEWKFRVLVVNIPKCYKNIPKF